MESSCILTGKAYPQQSVRSGMEMSEKVSSKEAIAAMEEPEGLSGADAEKWQEHQKIIERLVAERTEENLWEAIIACQGMQFFTYSGLPFVYALKRGRNGEYTKELWIDRRENSKSLSWGSLRRAFEPVKEGTIAVRRPKALGDIRGISYIYAIFLRFGLIEREI